jgi:hypothetical protein
MDLTPPGGSSTVEQIVAYEQSRGASDWTGPQGNADAWLLVQSWWNRGIYASMDLMSTLYAEQGRIG